MGLLDFFKPRRWDDAALGMLERRWGCWRGSIVLGEGPAVPLVLAGGRGAPGESALGLARELASRYPVLMPAIGQALWEHYTPYAEAIASGEEPAPDEFPRLTGPSEVWTHVSVVRVLIERMVGVETVEIAYRAAWDEEHTLGARFQEWRLVELNGSVRA